MSDLRKAFGYAASCWYADGMVNGREYGELADALLALVADPTHRLAILEAMGLDVREGWAWLDPLDSTAWEGGSAESGDASVPVFVVRPCGEVPMPDQCGVPGCSKTSTHSVYGVGANNVIPPTALTVCGDHVAVAEREGLAVRPLRTGDPRAHHPPNIRREADPFLGDPDAMFGGPV